MRCPTCKTENADKNLFCIHCGESLAWRCFCSAVNRNEHNYCNECGRSSSEITLNPSMEFVNSAVYQFSKNEIAELLRKSLLLTIDDKDGSDQDKVDQIFGS